MDRNEVVLTSPDHIMRWEASGHAFNAPNQYITMRFGDSVGGLRHLRHLAHSRPEISAVLRILTKVSPRAHCARGGRADDRNVRIAMLAMRQDTCACVC
eukprot:6856493-Prymnesium_polylepis.1